MAGRPTKRDAFGLLPKQPKVLEALLAGKTQRAAAAECGVGLRTVEGWCAEDPVFRAVLHARQRALSDDTGRTVAALSGFALRIVWDLASDTAVPPAVRLTAARDILDRAERYVDRAGELHGAAEKAAANAKLFEGLRLDLEIPLQVKADEPKPEDVS